MKPLFAIDVTKNRKNDKMNGEEFLARSLVSGKNDLPALPPVPSVKKRLPLALEIFKVLCGIGAVITALLLGVLSLLSSFEIALKDNLSLAIAGGLAAVIFALLFLFTPKTYVLPDPNKKKKEKLTKKQRALKEAIEGVYNELGVPESAEKIDVLSFHYKNKGNGNKIVMPRHQYTKYINVSLRMFAQDEKLCISDLANVYSFELSSLRKIVKIKNKVSVPFWNKVEKHDSPTYAKYGIKYKRGAFTIKEHYALYLEKDGEEYAIYFPSYELPKFELLAQITATKKK